MAEYARRLTEAGVRIVGGCCGSTPEHLRAMAAALGVRP
jgi:5-methyltetrahydrofolate--homocysteine methyltransferase